MIDEEEFVLVQENRAAAYRFFGRLFAAPLSDADINELERGAFAGASTGNEREDKGLREMAHCLDLRNTGTRERLNCDYTATFYGVQTLDGRVALPYESAFRETQQRYMGAARFEVFNVFKKCGLRVEEGYDLPEDHLSFLCEFMALRAERSARLFERGDRDELGRELAFQRAFLQKHILEWFPDFESLACQILEGRFYRGALEAAGGFFEADRRVLKDLVSASGARRVRIDLSEWEVDAHAGHAEGQKEAVRAAG